MDFLYVLILVLAFVLTVAYARIAPRL